MNRSERWRPMRAWLPVVVLLIGGCASVGGRPERTQRGGETNASGTLLEQALFRVRYNGVDGRGRLRLTLRAQGEAFRLSAADPFGRPLWSFAAEEDRALLLDHRESTYCPLEGEVTIEVVALSELPVRMLPRLLSGRLPVEPEPPIAPPETGDLELVDRRGRRWTARYADGLLVTWTLWQETTPILWWKREGDGGILSHRDGAQAVWTRTAHEQVPGGLEPLEPPTGYAPIQCDEDDAGDLA